MKSIYKKFFIILLFSIICSLFCSCLTASLIIVLQDREKMRNVMRAYNNQARDITNYVDYKIENFRFPDGKIADAYVFNTWNDGERWLAVQNNKYYKSETIKLQNQFQWEPTGPFSSYFKKYYDLIDIYGETNVDKFINDNLSPISYYKIQEFEKKDNITDKSYIVALYKDKKGLYCLILASSWCWKLDASRKHKGELGYKAVFLPNEINGIEPTIKLKPANTKIIPTTELPESDRELKPILPKQDTAYYYDEKLAYQLQWLAVEIACKGIYDMAYTGDFTTKNPHDYYKTNFIKSYLTKNDGKAHKGTVLFEGTCFDYADFAFQELKDNAKSYNEILNYWMVGTFETSDDIIAYRLATKIETPSMTINKTPVIIQGHNYIQAHSNATNHAWIWVKAKDNTIYWLDPTWTDNIGRPVYGIVRDGKEIQLAPSEKLCVN